MNEGGEGDEFKCPHCYKEYTTKKSLDRHLNYWCKKLSRQDVDLASSRVPPRCQNHVAEVTIDQEVDDLLATVEHPYARWRLAQKLSVCQQSSYPILFNYRFKGSKSSPLSSVCPTSDSCNVMQNVLIDAKNNFEVNKISMPKLVRVMDPDGSKVDVSKWLKPVNNRIDEDRVNRSDRPTIDVEETEDSFIYSLAGEDHDNDSAKLQEELEESIKMMSIDGDGDTSVDQFNLSGSISFNPMYNSSPAPRKSLFVVANELIVVKNDTFL